MFENDQSNELKEKILDLLERAFPNPMSVNDLSKYLEFDEQIIFKYLIELEENNLVKHLDVERQQWTRVIIAAAEEDTHSEFFFCFKSLFIFVLFEELILYKSISELSNAFRPTIAIITVNYFEKLAVDTMIENKVTFVRHKAGKEEEK